MLKAGANRQIGLALLVVAIAARHALRSYRNYAIDSRAAEPRTCGMGSDDKSSCRSRPVGEDLIRWCYWTAGYPRPILAQHFECTVAEIQGIVSGGFLLRPDSGPRAPALPNHAHSRAVAHRFLSALAPCLTQRGQPVQRTGDLSPSYL